MSNPFDPKSHSPGFGLRVDRESRIDEDHPHPIGPEPAAAPMSRHAAEWGLASLLAGAALMMTGAVVLVFNLIFWNAGPNVLDQSDMHLALVAALVGVPGMVGLCIASVTFGGRAIHSAATRRQPAGLALTGVLISGGALFLWLVVGADLLAILFSFVR